jgi:hypothetical protein
MRTFRVYRRGEGEIEAVKVGFSWPAFFFGGFWMIVKGFFGVFTIFFLINCVTFFAHIALANRLPRLDFGVHIWVFLIITLIGSLAVWLVPAIKGNSWRESDLVVREYELVSEVRAEAPKAATATLAPPNVRQQDSYT